MVALFTDLVCQLQWFEYVRADQDLFSRWHNHTAGNLVQGVGWSFNQDSVRDYGLLCPWDLHLSFMWFFMWQCQLSEASLQHDGFRAIYFHG